MGPLRVPSRARGRDRSHGVVSRIFLSPPDVGAAERDAVVRAIESSWVAPVGPELDAFEAELAEVTGRTHAVGLASGTSAIRLLLREAGVGPGDVVVCSTFTFIGSIAGAVPARRHARLRRLRRELEPLTRRCSQRRSTCTGRRR